MPHPAIAARRLNLGLTIPWTLVATAVFAVGLQSVPLARVAFRANEVLRRPGSSGPPFLPGRRYRNERSYGDLANLANIPAFRQYRLETFSTDQRGYRNPESASRGAAAILVGDSLGLGMGSQDSETLTARLTDLWGRPAYNASGMRPPYDLAMLRRLVRDLDMRRGVVILEFRERQLMPKVPKRPDLPTVATAAAETAPQRIRREVGAFWSACRIRILSEQLYRRVQNDTILPNPARSRVVVRQMADGQPILFLPGDVEPVSPDLEAGAEYFVWLRGELAKEGLGLAILLVPTKFTVYGPLLDPPAAAGRPGPDRLQRLESALRSRGVAVVNLEGPLQSRAREELDRGRYVYWRDDTHWNALGMEIAARELVRAIRDPAGLRPD